MLCDELKRHRPDIMVVGEGKAMAVMPEDPMGVWCHIQDVHDLLAEKDKEIESLKESHYADSIDAGIRERRLRRSLWLARAKRATEKADSFIHIKVTYNGVCNIDHSVYKQNNARRMLTCDEWLDVWTNVWEKCIKKAEEYK